MSSESITRTPLPDTPSVESTFREADGVSLHVVTAGDPADPLVILLHGFPEYWYEWSDYIEPLVAAGYRVLVPDQRGYNRSEKPASVRSYRISKLSGDIRTLVHSEDRESAHIIGHDWGGAVGWDLALRHPDTVDQLGIINAPHPVVFKRVLRSNLSQLRKSWYMFMFQLPRLPEWFFRRSNYEPLVSALREGSLSGAYSVSDLEQYRRAWAEEGALTGMLNWYQAAFRHRENPPQERVRAPTLLIWGEKDQALRPELAPESLNYCTEGRLEQFADATHWIPQEYPERVSELLVDHLES
jgi:pimeloyl-ACP methyl ester carboxylesterase